MLNLCSRCSQVLGDGDIVQTCVTQWRMANAGCWVTSYDHNWASPHIHSLPPATMLWGWCLIFFLIVFDQIRETLVFISPFMWARGLASYSPALLRLCKLRSLRPWKVKLPPSFAVTKTLFHSEQNHIRNSKNHIRNSTRLPRRPRRLCPWHVLDFPVWKGIRCRDILKL